MVKVRIVSEEELKEWYPIENSNFSEITKKIWVAAKDKEVVFVLVEDSNFPNEDYLYQVKVCSDTLMGNEELIPGKRLKFNCIVDDMVTEVEALAICYSYPIK